MKVAGRAHKVFERLGVWLQHRRNGMYGVIGIAVGLVILAQVLYPADHVMPFASLGSERVGLRPATEVMAKLQAEFALTTLDVRSGDKKLSVKLANLGASPNTEEMVGRLSKYPLWQRLIPFSALVIQPVLNKADVYFDQKKLDEASRELASKLSVDPRDASLAIKDGVLVATSAKAGRFIEADDLAAQLTRQEFDLKNTELRIHAKTLPPKTTDNDIAPVRQQAETTIARVITLRQPDGTVITPDRSTVASWLTLTRDDAGKIVLRANREAVNGYVKKIDEKLRIDPGVTTLDYVDGAVEGRTEGAIGSEVATEQLVEQLVTAIEDTSAPHDLTISMRPTQSAIVNNRRYTSSQKGLQSYVDYVTSTQNVHISLRQLNGEGWTAAGRAHDSIPSASTFKLYVAMVLFDKMDKGEIGWGDPMLDTNVAGCFERMTVASTNPCAERWIADFGRQYIDDFIHARGISGGSTFVTSGTAVRTTANDLLNVMIGLEAGTLYGGAHRDRLLDSLSRHPYRYGVPTGSNGRVWDKVGFLWDYVHDAAIVHHPRGTYVVAIMTRGQSYGRIAQITRELEKIMYP